MNSVETAWTWAFGPRIPIRIELPGSSCSCNPDFTDPSASGRVRELGRGLVRRSAGVARTQGGDNGRRHGPDRGRCQARRATTKIRPSWRARSLALLSMVEEPAEPTVHRDALAARSGLESSPADAGADEAAGDALLDDDALEDEFEDELGSDPAAQEGRGWHFARLAFHPVTLSYGTIVAIAVFSILTVVASPLAGGLGAAVVLVGTYVIVFVLAGRRADEDFYGLYAEERGLLREQRGSIPPVTPLLRAGESRAASQVMTGELPGGLGGTLALYTYELDAYEVDPGEDESEPEVDYFDFTVVLADVPEAALLSELSCEPRAGVGRPSSMKASGRNRRLVLGDESFDSNYEVFFDPRSDERRLRALFSAEFTSWLTDEAPPELGFELASGSLNVNVEDHIESVDELDELCEAAAVVSGRLREVVQA